MRRKLSRETSTQLHREAGDINIDSSEVREVAKFLANNPTASREEFTAWVSESGMEKDLVESIAMYLGRKFSLFLLSGLSVKKNVGVKDVDANQLQKGIKVEKEHTPEDDVAQRITLDHLAEIPDYYDRLAEMEKGAKNE